MCIALTPYYPGKNARLILNDFVAKRSVALVIWKLLLCRQLLILYA